MRGATPTGLVYPNFKEFQSTPPMRGATTSDFGDRLASLISIHAPHAGGDLNGPVVQHENGLFQSTPPMRGATLGLIILILIPEFQSTPPMRGATCLCVDFVQ